MASTLSRRLQCPGTAAPLPPPRMAPVQGFGVNRTPPQMALEQGTGVNRTPLQMPPLRGIGIAAQPPREGCEAW